MSFAHKGYYLSRNVVPRKDPALSEAHKGYYLSRNKGIIVLCFQTDC